MGPNFRIIVCYCTGVFNNGMMHNIPLLRGAAQNPETQKIPTGSKT